MTATPNTPAELQRLNQKEVFAEGLTNVELVEKLCHHSNLQPSDLVEVYQLLTEKLLNFHANVSAHVLEENEGVCPQDKLFWVMDATKLQVISNLVKTL